MLKIFKYELLLIASIIVIKGLSNILVLKVQTYTLSPMNFAIYSQFLTVVNIVINICNAAVISGITVLMSKAVNTTEKNEIVNSGKIYSYILAGIMSTILFIIYLMNLNYIEKSNISKLYYIMLIVLPWFITLSGVRQAILTSLGKLNIISKINNISTISIAVLSITFTLNYGLSGSIFVSLIGPIITAVIFVKYNKQLTINKSEVANDRKVKLYLYQLSLFSLAMMISGSAVPLSQFFVRGVLMIDTKSNSAGLWSALLRFSDVYMQFFGLLLTIVILPKLSAIKDYTELKKIFYNNLFLISTISLLILSLFFIFRLQIFSLIFPHEINSIINLCHIQIEGDFFRVISCYLFWFMYGSNLRVLAVVEEMVQAVLYYIMFSLNEGNNRVEDALNAYFVTSLINASIFVIILVYILNRKSRK